jgi:acyl carrier protein/surfactin synthase thioesterase subunit
MVEKTWAELLGVERVGPDDDFFDLGGNSLMVAAAVATLGERLGIELLPRALFEAPTPAEMVELIEELPAQRERDAGPVDGITPFFPEWVVQLQPAGAGRTVFVFPGGMGGKWTLVRDAKVASLVGREHPFYGFNRDPPHLERMREDWLQATAADYVAQMRNLQGRGPYLIYGICAGGPLAWEAARLLLLAGERIAGVIFYEVALDPNFANAQVSPEQARLQLARVGRVAPYVPEALPVDLTLLMTETWHARDRSAGWRQVAHGEVETVVMPGDTPGAHNLYVNREPMIAGHLRDWIAKSKARVRSA